MNKNTKNYTPQKVYIKKYFNTKKLSTTRYAVYKKILKNNKQTKVKKILTKL